MTEEKSLKKQLQRAEEELKDLETYIRDFVTFVPLSLCTLSPPGMILDVNNAFKELTGYDSVEIIGEPIEVIFLEKEKIEKILKEVIEKGVVRNRELTLVTKQRKKIPVSVSISLRKDKEGNFIGYFLGITDITELKKLQEELEEKVKERTRELQEKIEELERFQKLAVGRELKMVKLKEEIEKLKEELAKYKKA